MTLAPDGVTARAMGGRWVSLGVFLLTVLAVNAWSGRRDHAAGAPFSLRAPAEFEKMNKQEAAEMLLEDEEAAKTAGSGALFLRYGKDEEDKRYTEVLQYEEDDYGVRTGEADRSAHFDRGVIEIDDHPLKIIDSKITTLGGHEVIVGRLDAQVDSEGGKLPVRLTRYVVPTDRGRAVVDAYCLVKDEATYRPRFDQAVASARGIATRPGRLPWYYVSLIGGAAALITELAMRLRVKGKPAPAGGTKEPAEGEDKRLDEEDGAPEPRVKKTYKAKARPSESSEEGGKSADDEGLTTARARRLADGHSRRELDRLCTQRAVPCPRPRLPWHAHARSRRGGARAGTSWCEGAARSGARDRADERSR